MPIKNRVSNAPVIDFLYTDVVSRFATQLFHPQPSTFARRPKFYLYFFSKKNPRFNNFFSAKFHLFMNCSGEQI